MQYAPVPAFLHVLRLLPILFFLYATVHPLTDPTFLFPSLTHLQFLTSELVEASAVGTSRDWAFFRPSWLFGRPDCAHWLPAPDDKASSSLARGSEGFTKVWTTGGNSCLYCLDVASDCSQIKVNRSY